MAILDLAQAVKLLSILAAGYFLGSTLYQWHRLRHIPGPFLASFSYLWLANSGWCGRQHDIHKDLAEKYGPLVRIGPNEVSTDDPETIRRITSAKSAYPRSGWYDGARFHPEADAMFTMLDPARHDKHKAKTSFGYSGREVPDLESAFDGQIQNLIGLIRRKYVRKAGAGSPVVPLDLRWVCSLYALDAISRLALGKEFGCLEADDDIIGFSHTVEAFMPAMNVLGDVPWARKIVFSSLGIKLVGPKPTDPSGLGLMMNIINGHVHKVYADDGKDSTDILGSFRRHGVNEGQCQTEAFFMFVAGSETTASAMTTMFLYLTATPSAYHKLKTEIKSAIESGRASNPITGAEARKLPYLQAVVYEGLRIRPPATATFGKEVPPGGDTIHGHFLPGGTTVGPNLCALMRSKTLFGEDAEIFRPERFLEADEATRMEMQRNVELTFGSGRWMCAGKAIAFLEMNKTVFEVFRHFDFQIFRPQAGFISNSNGAWSDRDVFVSATEAEI